MASPDTAAIRERILAQRSPTAAQFDRRAVCTGTAAQIAVAQQMGRTVTSVFVGYLDWAGVVAAHDIKVEPEPDPPYYAAMVVAFLVGVFRACRLPLPYDELSSEQ